MKQFNFELLDDPLFKEDSVREEIITPLLNSLGYSIQGENSIIRSKPLVHPYVYIGTKKHKVNIIPDYLLQYKTENHWVLDAKAPSENILDGKNVEQAFSYAIHKDIRVKYYALCNGKEFVLFHVSKWPPVLYINLKTTLEDLYRLEEIIGANNRFPTDPSKKLTPDFGLYMLKLGLAMDKNGKKFLQIFMTISIIMVGKMDDNTYTLSTRIMFDDEWYLATFDFGKSLYNDFLNKIQPQARKEEIELNLSNSPFLIKFKNPSECQIGLAARIGDNIITNENESYCPFDIENFL
ncbi:type I restriction enzyme HsdR N-terminal domain-containing protein [Leptospira meyeri]|uniref:type I restriction enzyme HsdR N-terminal domain-containing protein n=1 Tax=Leptospira meyeri TaxID=29508 RepID=UPI001AEF441E|nr:type I restriction enzyme HsdR N-terminal domain-containing protein [Leptospira meyeri]